MKATAQESARAIKEMGRTKEIAARPWEQLARCRECLQIYK
ncbi:hypothetical protein [Bacillus infantis]|nr:hypothetical protein [Bacillus infantis]